MIRINKYLSESGICSRRAADKLIEEGKVTVAFYDNENKINEAEGNINSKNNQGVAIPQFYFQRFEFGMSWEYNYNNDEYSLWQLFDGYIDYARVWSRPLSERGYPGRS